MWPDTTSDLIAACTVRSLLLHFAASVAMDGQHRPSSLAQSASASRTIFSLSGRFTVQTAVMIRTLTLRAPPRRRSPPKRLRFAGLPDLSLPGFAG